MTHEIKATARDAGRSVVHTVTVDGEVVGTRRSARRYEYAIAEWVTVRRDRGDGWPERRVVVRRWSGKPDAYGSTFAVPVFDERFADVDDNDLARGIAHARNKRDAFAIGREPEPVARHLRDLLFEQNRRAHARRIGLGGAR
jgi:hypothetical protein